MQKESMAILAEDVVEMKDTVVELTRCHTILWTLWSTKNCKRYARVIEHHRDYFQTVASSLFQAFCIITYQIFDKRGDVKSFPQLIGYVSSLNPKLEQQLKSKIDSQRPLLDKFSSYRNKIFAHRDRSKRPWEIFGVQSKGRVRGEMKAILALAQGITGALAEAVGLPRDELVENFRLRKKYAAYGTRAVFEALGNQVHA